jgi:hypothetical protein
MKKLALLSFAALLFATVQAGAKTINLAAKSAEITSQHTVVVVDRKYVGKYGPGGEVIYIDKSSRYYYIDKRGHHIYVTKAQLRSHR